MTLEWRDVACEEAGLRDAIAAGGPLRLASGCEYQLTSNLPAITADIIIDGGGASIDGDGRYRLLYSRSANITIDDLAVHNGSGSGIATSDGAIIVTNSVLVGNETQGSGGGISSGAGDVSVFDSELIGNVAVTNGGGISVARGDLTITGSVLEGNRHYHGLFF